MWPKMWRLLAAHSSATQCTGFACTRASACARMMPMRMPTPQLFSILQACPCKPLHTAPDFHTGLGSIALSTKLIQSSPQDALKLLDSKAIPLAVRESASTLWLENELQGNKFAAWTMKEISQTLRRCQHSISPSIAAVMLDLALNQLAEADLAELISIAAFMNYTNVLCPALLHRIDVRVSGPGPAPSRDADIAAAEVLSQLPWQTMEGLVWVLGLSTGRIGMRRTQKACIVLMTAVAGSPPPEFSGDSRLAAAAAAARLRWIGQEVSPTEKSAGVRRRTGNPAVPIYIIDAIALLGTTCHDEQLVHTCSMAVTTVVSSARLIDSIQRPAKDVSKTQIATDGNDSTAVLEKAPESAIGMALYPKLILKGVKVPADCSTHLIKLGLQAWFLRSYRGAAFHLDKESKVAHALIVRGEQLVYEALRSAIPNDVSLIAKAVSISRAAAAHEDAQDSNERLLAAVAKLKKEPYPYETAMSYVTSDVFAFSTSAKKARAVLWSIGSTLNKVWALQQAKAIKLSSVLGQHLTPKAVEVITQWQKAEFDAQKTPAFPAVGGQLCPGSLPFQRPQSVAHKVLGKRLQKLAQCARKAATSGPAGTAALAALNNVCAAANVPAFTSEQLVAIDAFRGPFAEHVVSPVLIDAAFPWAGVGSIGGVAVEFDGSDHFVPPDAGEAVQLLAEWGGAQPRGLRQLAQEWEWDGVDSDSRGKGTSSAGPATWSSRSFAVCGSTVVLSLASRRMLAEVTSSVFEKNLRKVMGSRFDAGSEASADDYDLLRVPSDIARMSTMARLSWHTISVPLHYLKPVKDWQLHVLDAAVHSQAVDLPIAWHTEDASATHTLPQYVSHAVNDLQGAVGMPTATPEAVARAIRTADVTILKFVLLELIRIADLGHRSPVQRSVQKKKA